MNGIERKIEEIKEAIEELEWQIEKTTSNKVSVRLSIEIDNLWSNIAQLEDELSSAKEEME